MNCTGCAGKTIRANNPGMRILIDFHDSELWADGSHLTYPILLLEKPDFSNNQNKGLRFLQGIKSFFFANIHRKEFRNI